MSSSRARRQRHAATKRALFEQKRCLECAAAFSESDRIDKVLSGIEELAFLLQSTLSCLSMPWCSYFGADNNCASSYPMPAQTAQHWSLDDYDCSAGASRCPQESLSHLTERVLNALAAEFVPRRTYSSRAETAPPDPSQNFEQSKSVKLESMPGTGDFRRLPTDAWEAIYANFNDAAASRFDVLQGLGAASQIELVPSVGSWRHPSSSSMNQDTETNCDESAGLHVSATATTYDEGKTDKACAVNGCIEGEEVTRLKRLHSHRMDAVMKIPEEAFGGEQAYWLAKFVTDAFGLNNVALMLADGIITSRTELLEELQREGDIELADLAASSRGKRRKRKKNRAEQIP